MLVAKSCSICGGLKLLHEYPICYGCKDGREGRCKACRAVWLREYRQTEQSKQVTQVWEEKYAASARGKEVMKRKVSKYQHKFPLKRRARIAVTHAVSAGRLPRASTQECEHCGLPAGSWHHCSYEEEHWLKVVPLCGPCHTQTHRQETIV